MNQSASASTLNPFNVKNVMLSVLAIAIVAAMALAFAYGNGTEQTGFKDVWEQITQYMQGSLGRVLVGLIVVVGIAAAVVRQSLMTFAVAVGAAIGLYYAPDIVNGIMSSSEAVATILPVL
ncbi:TraA family conjugative transfer protein [Xenorhabdus sp. TH1]|uniref:TraA family conjugative transfer protein n=1 Tax=Xenorhabdus sp. TH1 TaxID=3130166 RepID=UPI0030D1674C